MPKRIQRSRQRGWRMPEGAVYVGRPTKWGNPYYVGQVGDTRRWTGWYVGDLRDRDADYGSYPTQAKALGRAVELFRQQIWGTHYDLVLLARKELAGKDLACWCKPGDPCHADVLLEIANGGQS